MQLSVIVPIYNAEKYLPKCIDSILAQTFQDYELILIDDGSTDGSGEMCNQYAVKENRIRVFHKKNEGLICARIDGLKYARGEYVAFVDADDWIDEDFYEIMMGSVWREQADIVITGCIRERKDRKEVISNNIPSGIYKKEELIQKVYPYMLHYQKFFQFGILPYMVTKLYKRELLLSCYENINTKIYDGEDVAVVYPYLLKAEKAVILPDAKYHYRIHEKSLTAMKKDDFYENCCNLYLHLYNKFKETEYSKKLCTQLDRYMRYMVWMGNPRGFDANGKYIFPFPQVPCGAKIALYGAGDVGMVFSRQIKKTGYCDIVLWVDKSYQRIELQEGGVVGLDALKQEEYEYVVIAIAAEEIAMSIREELHKDYEIPYHKIVWQNPVI